MVRGFCDDQDGILAGVLQGSAALELLECMLGCDAAKEFDVLLHVDETWLAAASHLDNPDGILLDGRLEGRMK